MTINQNVFNMAVTVFLYTQLKCLKVLSHAIAKPFLLVKEEHTIKDACYFFISLTMYIVVVNEA